MRFLLIPVKDLARAKQRLSSVMTQGERTLLAEEMMRQTMMAAAGAQRADRVAVVTLYPPAISLAASLGIEVIREMQQISESASVDFGSIEAMRRGAESVLRVPIDLPLITSDDLDWLLDKDCGEPSAILVPSRDGTGTNALFRRPPDIFPSRFGTNSLAHHLEEARQAGIPCRVIERPSIGFDLDEPEDLVELFRRHPSLPLATLLRGIGVDQRL